MSRAEWTTKRWFPGVGVLILVLAGGGGAWAGPPPQAPPGREEGAAEPELLKVRAVMQERPGGPTEEVEVAVHPVPVNPPALAAEDADLPAEDLVLGVVADGRAVAYPVRYLALHEVLNDQVGEVGLAPTW